MPRSAFVVLSWIAVLALFAVAVFAVARPSGSDGAADADPESSALATSEAVEPAASPDASPAPDTSDDPAAGDAAADGPVVLDEQQLRECIVPGGDDPRAVAGTRDIPDAEVPEQIDAISEVVTDLRGLSFAEDPEPEFFDDEELRERLEREVREEYSEEEADVDARLLAALGALEPDTDLIELQSELLGEQVGGFYDPDTGELVVRAGDVDEGLDAFAQTVLAHELQHAVADQRLDLPVDVTEDISDSDAGLAASALIEGDASLTESHFFFSGLTLEEQIDYVQDPTVASATAQLEGVPHYLRRSLEFPYTAGLEFTCVRYLDGGWEAVDATYDALPSTSVEILDPSRYPFEPVDPRDPGEPGAGWTEALSTTMGAADLLWLFEAPGDDTSQALDDPRGAALEWTGGELELWTDGDDTAVGIALTQRQPDGPLCDAVATWYERAFPDSTDAPPRSGERLIREGGRQTAVVTCDGEDVRVGIAADLPTARALVE